MSVSLHPGSTQPQNMLTQCPLLSRAASSSKHFQCFISQFVYTNTHTPQYKNTHTHSSRDTTLGCKETTKATMQIIFLHLENFVFLLLLWILIHSAKKESVLCTLQQKICEKGFFFYLKIQTCLRLLHIILNLSILSNENVMISLLWANGQDVSVTCEGDLLFVSEQCRVHRYCVPKVTVHTKARRPSPRTALLKTVTH